MSKSPDAFRTISEVADWLGVQAHVLRFWESKFTQVKPVKRAGGRRYYRPADMQLLGGIRKLLHDDGLSIKDVQALLRDRGAAHVAALSPPLDAEDGPAEAAPLPAADNLGADWQDSMELPQQPHPAAAQGDPEPGNVLGFPQPAAETPAAPDAALPDAALPDSGLPDPAPQNDPAPQPDAWPAAAPGAEQPADADAAAGSAASQMQMDLPPQDAPLPDPDAAPGSDSPATPDVPPAAEEPDLPEQPAASEEDTLLTAAGLAPDEPLDFGHAPAEAPQDFPQVQQADELPPFGDLPQAEPAAAAPEAEQPHETAPPQEAAAREEGAEPPLFPPHDLDEAARQVDSLNFSSAFQEEPEPEPGELPPAAPPPQPAATAPLAADSGPPEAEQAPDADGQPAAPAPEDVMAPPVAAEPQPDAAAAPPPPHAPAPGILAQLAGLQELPPHLAAEVADCAGALRAWAENR